jgi:hypothetical protein
MKVCDEEWSFGYCEFGTGVFCCAPTMNPMYTHRESIVLGHMLLSRRRVGQILSELSREWNGSSYDPLSRNCNHFCDALCERLGVQKLPRKGFLAAGIFFFVSSIFDPIVMCEGENKRNGTAAACCLHTVLYIWLVYVSVQALCVSRYGISG